MMRASASERQRVWTDREESTGRFRLTIKRNGAQDPGLVSAWRRTGRKTPDGCVSL